MEEKYIIIHTFVSYSDLMKYIDIISYEYKVYDMDFEVEIYYRILFDDYKLKITVCV